MSSSVRGRGGSLTMYLKHLKSVSKAEPAIYTPYIWTYLQALVELLLLLVDYTQSEVDFVGLFEIRGHSHNLRESFLRMIKRAIAVIEDTNPIPQFRFL